MALDGAAFRRRNGPVSGPETKGVACGARRGDELQNPASEYDTAGWVARSAQDLGAQIGIYDVHAYPGQHEVRSGAYAEKLRRIRAEVPAGKN